MARRASRGPKRVPSRGLGGRSSPSASRPSSSRRAAGSAGLAAAARGNSSSGHPLVTHVVVAGALHHRRRVKRNAASGPARSGPNATSVPKRPTPRVTVSGPKRASPPSRRQGHSNPPSGTTSPRPAASGGRAGSSVSPSRMLSKKQWRYAFVSKKPWAHAAAEAVVAARGKKTGYRSLPERKK
jgi:hypothetical protein